MNLVAELDKMTMRRFRNLVFNLSPESSLSYALRFHWQKQREEARKKAMYVDSVDEANAVILGAAGERRFPD